MAGEASLARGLGWFSIGLGLAAIAEPRGVARLIGVREDDAHRDVLMAVGLREIASGIGILTRPWPTGWLWARVAGDVMDLSLLFTALSSDDSQKDRVAATTAAIIGITGVDLYCSQQLSRNNSESLPGSTRQGRTLEVHKTITVNRPSDELYRFWHDFENLPRFMNHLESVQVAGDRRRSHWKAKAPAGTTVEWDAEITEDRPGELVAWRSMEGSQVDNAGTVRFTPAPGGRGTEVHVDLQYNPPGGIIGAAVAKLFGEEPEQQIHADLHRFKQLVETGEVVRSEGTLTSTDRLLFRGERPGQPPAVSLS